MNQLFILCVPLYIFIVNYMSLITKLMFPNYTGHLAVSQVYLGLGKSARRLFIRRNGTLLGVIDHNS